MKFSAFLNIIVMTFTVSSAFSQQMIELYPGPIPGSKPHANEEKTVDRNGVDIVSQISVPTLQAFLPPKEKSTGTAVIVCPGGGYWVNAIEHEGTDVARALNELGVAAFVLKYRIPNDETMSSRESGPLQDLQQAISVVRAGATQYGVDASRIGVMGFSAGGHLASTAGTHFEKPVINSTVSVRPDFMILIYPVISFSDEFGHRGSRDQLIGKSPSPEMIQYYSNDLRVTPSTPPTFLVHASDDEGVPAMNSVAMYTALIKNKVPAELHLYQKGGHGFGLNNKTTQDRWIDRCANWLKSNGWI